VQHGGLAYRRATTSCHPNCSLHLAQTVAHCSSNENLLSVLRPLQEAAALAMIHGFTCPHISTPTYCKQVEKFHRDFNVPKSLESLSEKASLVAAWKQFIGRSKPNDRMPRVVKKMAQEKLRCFLTHLGKVHVMFINTIDLKFIRIAIK
jgi:hypothetical protein